MIQKYITVHCSDSPDGRVTTVEEIRQWHLARGFQDIGYHFVIYVDGGSHVGRLVNIEGAHVQGHNEGNIGICLVGRSRFSIAQWKSLLQLVQYLMQLYEIPIGQVYCHRDWDTAIAQGKTCPNFDRQVLHSWIVGGFVPPDLNIYPDPAAPTAIP